MSRSRFASACAPVLCNQRGDSSSLGRQIAQPRREKARRQGNGGKQAGRHRHIVGDDGREACDRLDAFVAIRDTPRPQSLQHRPNAASRGLGHRLDPHPGAQEPRVRVAVRQRRTGGQHDSGALDRCAPRIRHFNLPGLLEIDAHEALVGDRDQCVGRGVRQAEICRKACERGLSRHAEGKRHLANRGAAHSFEQKAKRNVSPSAVPMRGSVRHDREAHVVGIRQAGRFGFERIQRRGRLFEINEPELHVCHRRSVALFQVMSAFQFTASKRRRRAIQKHGPART